MSKVKHYRDRPRADLRIIANILSRHHKIKKPSEKVLEYISLLFTRRGGSWVLFFEGNPTHIVLLKKIIKAVVKRSKKK